MYKFVSDDVSTNIKALIVGDTTWEITDISAEQIDCLIADLVSSNNGYLHIDKVHAGVVAEAMDDNGIQHVGIEYVDSLVGMGLTVYIRQYDEQDECYRCYAFYCSHRVS